MPKRRKLTKATGGLGAAMAVLIVIASAVITLSEQMGLGGVVPTWDELFVGAELAPPEAESAFTDPTASVHIIDVGQGDSILIKTPEHNILIDASEREYAPEIISYLQAQGVTSLDYVVATHPHADHIGGLAQVITQMDVENVIAPKVPDSITPTTKSYKDMLTAIKNKGLKIKQAKPGDYYELGDTAGFTIVGPAEPSDEMNNNSVVLKFEYGDVSFLLTGDCEKDMEQKILDSGADVSADVLKLGHHGSSTSTGKKWLAAVNPSYSVASCGLDNSYGHPHEETVERLGTAQIPLYRTDLNGTVVFETNGTAIHVATEK